MLRITALMDNKPSEQKALIAEHGLSLLIEGRGQRVLFDCGSGRHMRDNAEALGLSLKGLHAVILSHAHYDHAGGYRGLINEGLGSSVLYTGKHFFEPKFAQDGTCYTDLSAGFDQQFLAENGIEHRETGKLREIAPGMWLVGDFERNCSFETIPERFVRLTDAGFIPDDFPDEICLAIDVGGSLAVLVGCSHPGILNMIETVHERLAMPVSAVYGGTHLVEADNERILETIRALRKMGLERFGLSHCTGDRAEQIIAEDENIESCHLSTGCCAFYNDM